MVEAGGIMPSLPNELKVYVDPADVDCSLPTLTTKLTLADTETLDGIDVLAGGRMIISLPVEKTVKVAPDTTTSVEPMEIETNALGERELSEAIALGVGVMMPPDPKEVCVAVEKNVVISPLALVVEAGT
jgi:hypothetical protein